MRPYALLIACALQPKDFPNPLKVDPRRPKDKYQLQGAGFHNCPGYTFAEQTIPEILKIVFSLKNLRRAEGTAGKMAGFMLNAFGTDNRMYLDNTGNVTPWPGSLTLVVRILFVCDVLYLSLMNFFAVRRVNCSCTL